MLRHEPPRECTGFGKALDVGLRTVISVHLLSCMCGLRSDESGGFLTASRLENALSRSRILRKFARRATRPQHQFTTAIGAPSAEDPVRARAAERAFERTNECVNRVGWQITIATFAVRSQLQHLCTPSLSCYSSGVTQPLLIKETTSKEAPGRAIVKIEVPVGAEVFAREKLSIRLGHQPNKLLIR